MTDHGGGGTSDHGGGGTSGRRGGGTTDRARRAPGAGSDRASNPTLALSVVLLGLAVTLVGVAGAGFVGASVQPPGGDRPGVQFENATAESGLEYADDVETGIGNGNAGVYALDYDDDGWTDLLAIGDETPALFRNDEGTFEESDALPALERTFKSAAVVDYDGDGLEDVLFFPRYGEVLALHNEGGTFERDDVGLGNVSYPLGAAAADYDGDGDRDLFVYQSGNWREGKPAGQYALNRTITDDNGYPNVLYENVDGEFRRVEDAGIEGDRWSLAASFTDLTGDGLPDVHVANDFNNDVLYRNNGDGTFDRTLLAGATARNGMASEIADVTGDGRPDVFVTNIYLPISPETMGQERYDRLERIASHAIHSGRTKGNTLQENRRDGELVDRADELGVRHGGWGWAAAFEDFDNDGRLDLMHTTQRVVRIDPDDPHYTYPMLWWNEGDEFRSLDASERGLAEMNGRGMATLDYDRDGNVDVVTANYDEPYTVYENTATNGSALQVRVVDDAGATALGAEVTVASGRQRTTLSQNGETDYLSQDSRVAHVGLGDRSRADVTVTWPDGTERTFEDVAAGQRIRIGPDGLETVTTFDDHAAVGDDSADDGGH